MGTQNFSDFLHKVTKAYRLKIFKKFKIFLIGLRYLSFCPDFFGHIEKCLDKKANQFQNILPVNRV